MSWQNKTPPCGSERQPLRCPCAYYAWPATVVEGGEIRKMAQGSILLQYHLLLLLLRQSVNIDHKHFNFAAISERTTDQGGHFILLPFSLLGPPQSLSGSLTLLLRLLLLLLLIGQNTKNKKNSTAAVGYPRVASSARLIRGGDL